MPNSGVVDERILEMQIDHDKFESGAKKTLNILEKLDLGLKSLGKNNADGFDSVASALDKVTQRFSAMGIAGDQIIRNLTNKAIGLVEQMGHVAKSLSIDQINAGWDKYGEKTQGVQTIMAATAKDWDNQAAQMDYVNAQLEKLNWFTDETSYSFLDMVNNIGKFTSNGVKLDTAVTAMEGISTWAAMSGANVGEASRAMYNLSQALATGSVKLIDWKSIENANMATREFKETALETAVAIGQLTKAGTKWKTKTGKTFTTEQFNTQLSEGWFTSDVLLETLNKYGSFTDALNEATEATGMTASEMLRAVDAYEESQEATAELLPWVKKLSSEEYALGRKAFAAAQEAKTYADAINATKDAVSTGWMNLFETMFGNYLTAKEFWTDVAESLYNIFAEPVNKLNEIFNIAFKNPNPLKDQLAEAGYTMGDLEAAAGNLGDKTITALVEEFGSIEEAIKKGKVSLEQFQKLLDQLSIDRIDQIINGKNEDFNKEIEKLRQYAEWFTNGAVTEETMTARGIDVDMVKWWAAIIEQQTKEAKAVAEAISSSNDQSLVDYKKAKAYLDANGISIDDFEQAAKNLGSTELDKAINKYGSLQAAIEKGAVSVDLFKTIMSSLNEESTDPYVIQFMDQYSDQLLHLAGYTDEEIAKLKELGLTANDVLGDMTDEKVTRAEGFKLFTESIMNLLHAFEQVAEAAARAFDIFFGGTEDAEVSNERIGEKIYGLLERFNKFTESLQFTDERLSELTDSFVSLLGTVGEFNGLVDFAFSILKKAGAAFLQVLGAVKDSRIIGSIFRSLKLIFEGLVAPIKVVLDYFKDLLDRSELFGEQTWVELLARGFAKLGVTLNAAAYRFKEFMTDSKRIEWLQNQLERMTNVIVRLVNGFKQNGLAGVFNELSQMLNNFLARHPTLQKIYNVIARIVEIAKTGFAYVKQFFGLIVSAFKDINISDLFKDFSFEKIITIIRQLATTIGTIIVDIFSNLFSENGLLSKLKGLIGPALLALIGHGILSTIRKAKKTIGGVGEIIENISGFTKRLKKGPSKFKEFARNILMIAVSIGILAVSLAALAHLSWPQLLIGFVGLASIMGVMLLLANSAQSLDGKRFSAFIPLALAIAVLAMTLKSLSTLSWDQLLVGMVALASIMGVMILIANSAKSLKGQGFSAFIPLALAVVVLAMTLKSLSTLSWDQLLVGMVALASIMGVMILIANSAKSLKGQGFSAFIPLALAVVVLAMTLKSLSTLSWEQLLVGMVGLASIMGVMILVANSAKSLKGQKYLAFIPLALTIAVLAMTLKSLSTLSWEQLLVGMVGLASIMGVLVLVSNHASSVKGKGFGQLILLSLSIVIIAGALAILARYSWQSILASVAAMVIGIGALVGLSIVIQMLGNIPVALVAKGIAVMAVIVAGVALIIWGLIALGSVIVDSAIGLAEKLARFADSLKPFAESISSFDDGTSSNFRAFATMMKEIMVAEFWTMIASLFAKLGDSEVLAAKLTSFISGLKPFLSDVALVTAESVTGAGYLASMMSALLGAQITSDIGGWINGLNGENATKLSNFMTNLDGFISSVGSVTPDAVTGASNLSAMMQALVGGEVWGSLGELFDGLSSENGQKLSDFMVSIEGFLENVGSIDQTKLDGASNLSTVMRSAFGANFWTTIGSWFSGDNATYAQELSDFTSALIPFLNNMASIDSTMLSNVDSVFTTLATLTQSNVIQLFGSQLQSFYENLQGNSSSGIFGKEGLVERDLASFQIAIGAIADFVNSLSSLQSMSGTDNTGFFNLGSSIIGGISEGVTSNEASLTTELTATVGRAIAAVNVDSASDIGSNIVYGIINGLGASAGIAKLAAAALATDMLNAARNALGIHSPSRAFAALAAFIPAGVAQGIEENTGTAIDSITIMSSGILAAMQQAMMNVATIADDSFEYNPMITPVVDMSNVTAAAGSAGGMFGGVGMALRASSRVSMDTAQNTAAAVTYGGGAESIVSELQRMGSRLDNLGEAITNMKVVLDSGELVGATSRQMDDAFGVLQMRKGRGN